MSTFTFAQEVKTLKYIYKGTIDYLCLQHKITNEEGVLILRQIWFGENTKVKEDEEGNNNAETL